MEQDRKQELADLQALQLCGVFNTPIPDPATEAGKELDKVKEPPNKHRNREREER